MSRSRVRVERLAAQLEASHCSNTASAELQPPLKVVVTGAAGNIAYSILFHIGAGRLLGDKQPIHLCLLDIAPMATKIEGVAMEIRDCAFPLIHEIVCTTDYEEAFRDADVALLIGARPRGPGMDRADLLSANAKIFAGQGHALNQFAKRSVKVVVVGNPANTNALITSINAPDIPPENITALTRLDQSRAVAQVAAKTSTRVADIHNIIVWGNHSKTQYPDVNHAVVRQNGRTLPLRSVINDDNWIRGEFLTTVQQRGAAIIKARKLSSAASAANAVIDHVHSWALGTPKGTVVSMAVPSDGSYGIPKGIIYSFPVTCSNFEYKIVQGLHVDAFSREKMMASAQELLEEKSSALSL